MQILLLLLTYYVHLPLHSVLFPTDSVEGFEELRTEVGKLYSLYNVNEHQVSWWGSTVLLLNTKFEFTWNNLRFVYKVWPSQLSCLGSSVGRASLESWWSSWVWVPPEAANEKWLFRASCVVLFCLSVVFLPCLAFLGISWSSISPVRSVFLWSTCVLVSSLVLSCVCVCVCVCVVCVGEEGSGATRTTGAVEEWASSSGEEVFEACRAE